MTISDTTLASSSPLKPLQEQEAFHIKSTPFVFLRRVAYIQVGLALLAILLTTLFGPERVNESLRLLDTIVSLLVAIGTFTAVQVLLITLAFLTWQAETYEVDRQRIIWRRAGLFEARLIAETQKINDIHLRQGWLARQLDFGTLLIYSEQGQRVKAIRNIPNPHRYWQLIDNLIVRPAVDEPAHRPKTLAELIAQGEDQYLEFKSSLMWDYRRERVNKDLYVPVMKNVAAFMNTTGGKVLIGIDDEGQVLGLEKDYTGMRKADPDGYENTFNMAFNKMIGAEFRPYVTVSFPEVDERQICLVSIKPSDYPVYFYNKGQEYFYIRTGNASQALSISKATKYIRSRYLS